MSKTKQTKQLKQFKRTFIESIVIIDFITIALLYLIMPIIQGYPPYTENFAFQQKVQTLTHVEQYIIVLLIGIAMTLVAMKLYMKNIYRYINSHSNKEEIEYSEILKVRKDCLNVPYKLAIFELSGILLLGLLLNLIMLVQFLAVIKFTMMIVSLASITSLLLLIISQKYLNNILFSTYEVNSKYEMHNGFRIKNSLGLQIQMMPFIAVVLIIVSLIGYSKAMEKQANASSNYYEVYLERENIGNDNISTSALKNTLNKIPLKNEKDYYFIIEPDDKDIYVSKESGSISQFVLDYRDFFFDKTNGRLYERFGVDEQLFAKKITDTKGQAWYIGFKFEVIDNELFLYYSIIIILVLTIYAILSYVWAINFSKNTDRISKKLRNILESEQEINNKNILPIMSNDELGDLSYYYNKIQEKLINQQVTIQKQGQLATLGELAGGMAHDINTPISAIDTAILMLEKRVEGTEEQKEIITNMKICTDKIKAIVNGMRNQIRNLGSTEKQWFEVSKIISDLNIILKNELIKAKCVLNVDINENVKIYGERNKLSQVITNLIMNSIQAYSANSIEGDINVIVKQEKENCIIKVIDEAGGIPEKMQELIFKNILTTKGTQGTGIGLYLAYSVIKGVFEGNLTFETIAGKGTTFIIEIPNNFKEESKNGE